MNFDETFSIQFEIAPAGMVQAVVDLHGQAWAAGLSGLYRYSASGWEHILPGADFLQSRALLIAEKILLIAGLTGGAVFSLDTGKSWNSSWIEQTNAPINCFAASPNFAHDGVILAGLDGDGILRAERGGRFWRLSNFGLRNFSINCLAVVPPWGRREIVLAGTADGAYRSLNGGRAWRFCGLEGQAVRSLAVGRISTEPDTAIILAGTESGGLFRSLDGGENWERAPFDSPARRPVNALWSDGDQIFLAAAADGVWRSHDGGLAWGRLVGSPAAVQSLAGPAQDGRFFAAGVE